MLLNYAISAVQACLLSSSQVDNQRHEATDRASCAGSRACAVARCQYGRRRFMRGNISAKVQSELLPSSFVVDIITSPCARRSSLASAERSAAAEHQGSESTVLAACDSGYLGAATLGDGFAPFVRSQRKRKSFTPLSAAPRTEFLREKGTPNAVVWSASARIHTPMIPWRSTVPWLERRLRQPLPARRK